jgi:ubiquinone/menaquinone biosynthesis C-methylase UbiE
MAKIPKWQYDEFKYCGVDFSDPAEVELYEKNHQQMRNFKREARNIINLLEIDKKDTVIDFGCGTGAFVFNAAEKCRRIYAVDVSKAMLDFCKKKCRNAGIKNVEFYRAGFLTYEHKEKPVDVIITKLALHHLPDFWKAIALKRMAAMLKNGGKLYLSDVVFSFDAGEHKKSIERWIKAAIKRGDSDFKRRIETHIGQEFSTFGWIMEGLLVKAGFKIIKADYKDGFFANYICSKTG